MTVSQEVAVLQNEIKILHGALINLVARMADERGLQGRITINSSVDLRIRDTGKIVSDPIMVNLELDGAKEI